MNDETALALNALNRAFYRDHADAFSARRERPWRGWQRLLEWLPKAPGTPLAVLDVGCGNARFGRFLAGHRPLARYVGVDASEPLLAIARERAPRADDCRFVHGDFVSEPPERVLPREPFDLVALFGVLHGVPGRRRRRALLEAASRRLAPGGLLVFTCWRFADDPRLAGRVVPWERAPAWAAIAGDLGPDDHLLPWGSGGEGLRYAADVGPEERAWLARAVGLAAVTEFCADGPHRDLNHYTLWRLR